MRFFSEDEVRRLLQPDELIRAIRAVFARDDRGTLRMPVRTRLELSGCVLLLMPCYDSALNAAGVKLVTVNAQSGVRASYALLDPASGELRALMEANTLTDLRTAATSAVATDMLARHDVKTLGIFGAGRQAAAHLCILPRVRNFRRFLVCGSPRSDMNHFRGKMKAEHGIEIEIADAETCARESDVICTCTTSSEPVFDGRWLRAGAHLNLIGGFRPKAREVDDETIRKACIVVDTYEGVLAESGDLLVPLEKGVIDRSHIVGDLHEIVSGKKTGRTGPADITLFKSVGCAIEDLVAAKLVSSKLP
jgi:ornithine cyclodeaminase/alanine dehydrogenase-like protein (mu-crystallin family)